MESLLKNQWSQAALDKTSWYMREDCDRTGTRFIKYAFIANCSMWKAFREEDILVKSREKLQNAVPGSIAQDDLDS